MLNRPMPCADVFSWGCGIANEMQGGRQDSPWGPPIWRAQLVQLQSGEQLLCFSELELAWAGLTSWKSLCQEFIRAAWFSFFFFFFFSCLDSLGQNNLLLVEDERQERSHGTFAGQFLDLLALVGREIIHALDLWPLMGCDFWLSLEWLLKVLNWH